MNRLPKSTRLPPPPPRPTRFEVELTEEEARIICVALAIAEPLEDSQYMKQLEIRKRIIELRNKFAYHVMSNIAQQSRIKEQHF